MSTMQQFYNQLSSETPQENAYMQALAQLAKESLARILELADGARWDFWSDNAG